MLSFSSHVALLGSSLGSPFTFPPFLCLSLATAFRHCHRRTTLDAASHCFASKTISATILRGLDNSRSGNAIVAALLLAPFLGPLHDPTYVEASSLLRGDEVRPRKLSSDVVTHLRGENGGFQMRGARNRLLSKLGQCRFGDGKLNNKSIAR